MANYSKNIKAVASKQGFSLVVWAFVLVIALWFMKSIIGFLKPIMGFISGAPSEQQQQAQTQQLSFIETLKKKYPSLYKAGFLPRPRSFYVALANSLEQQMNRSNTDFKLLAETIKPLNGKELIALYIEFGSRLNEEYSNEQGDLIDWIIMEDNMSPLQFFGKSEPLKQIAKQFQPTEGILPSALKLEKYLK